MAATSLLVAAKVEESTRRIKDFVNACAQKAAKNDKLVLDENSKVKSVKEQVPLLLQCKRPYHAFHCVGLC